MEIDVICLTRDENKDPDEVVVGRIGVDRFQYRGLSDMEIVQACDAQSEVWAELWETLFVENEIHPDLAGGHMLEEIAFTYDVVIHPILEQQRAAILSAIMRLFTSVCLRVVWKSRRGLDGLSASEIRGAGAIQVFHPEVLVWTPASKLKRPRSSQKLEKIVAPFDAEAWVNQRWHEE